jgi:hypothetical protein
VTGAEYDAFVAKYEPFSCRSALPSHAYDASTSSPPRLKVAVKNTDNSLVIGRRACAMPCTDQGVQGADWRAELRCNRDCANPTIGVYEYHAGAYPPELIWPE